MIPSLDPSTGLLPVGRHVASFSEIEAVLVLGPQFAASTTRAGLWEGLRRYLALWASVQEHLGERLGERRLLKWLWLGGSFVSDRIDPHNLDLTLFADGPAIADCKGVPGVGRIVKLSHRAGMLDRYGVSPIVIKYYPVPSPFVLDALTPEQREYIALRGGFDDWWQRARPEGEPKGPPTMHTVDRVRGYLEVAL
jgi:hypothetical protein